MRDLAFLAVQLVVTVAKLTRPGGVRAVPDHNRFVLGLTTLFVRPRRVAKLTTILKPATLLRLHKALVDRKYRRLFSSTGTRRKPGPRGPMQEIISAILEMKFRNPRFGNQRIAQQISQSFRVQIDKDVVR